MFRRFISFAGALFLLLLPIIAYADIAPEPRLGLFENPGVFILVGALIIIVVIVVVVLIKRHKK